MISATDEHHACDERAATAERLAATDGVEAPDGVGVPRSVGDDLDAWSEEELEDGLTTLAGQIAAATCRFLLLLAEYDRRRGWARWDCVSAAQWLSWRCQIGPRTAREHLRVAHRLGELPAITEQFRAGRLSYSKVRAITRVATPDNEADLLALARHGTAAQLERAVSAYRRFGRVDDDAMAVDQLRGRRLDWRYEGDGSMVIRVRLPADRGEVALTALRAVLDHTDGREQATTTETDADTPGDEADTDEADGSLPVGDVPADDSGDELDGDVAGSASADELDDDAATDRADARGSAEPPGEVADDPRAAAYADAFVAVAEHALACNETPRSTGDRHQVVVHIDAETLADPSADGESSLDSGRALAPSTVHRIACDAAIVPVLSDALGEPLDIGRKRRTIPTGLRRAVLARDRRCRYPTCERTIDEVHHIHHWTRGGETRIGNLVGLCWFHHARHHQDAFDIRFDTSGSLIFEHPDGQQLTDWAPPGGYLEELLADLAQRDIEIAAGTAVNDWSGDPLDLELATWILTTRDVPHADGYASGHDPHEGWTATADDTAPMAR